MNSAIQLCFRYSEQDYVRAMRAHFASRVRLKSDVAVALGLALLGMYTWRSLDSPWYSMAAIGAAIILLLMLLAAFTVIPVVLFRREAKFRDEYSLTFSEDGIHFQTEHINSQLQWKLYDRALIDARSFILYYGARSFTVIPKRVFQGAAQLAVFEGLLAQKIPQISRKDS